MSMLRPALRAGGGVGGRHESATPPALVACNCPLLCMQPPLPRPSESGEVHACTPIGMHNGQYATLHAQSWVASWCEGGKHGQEAIGPQHASAYYLVEGRRSALAGLLALCGADSGSDMGFSSGGGLGISMA